MAAFTVTTCDVDITWTVSKIHKFYIYKEDIFEQRFSENYLSVKCRLGIVLHVHVSYQGLTILTRPDAFIMFHVWFGDHTMRSNASQSLVQFAHIFLNQ